MLVSTLVSTLVYVLMLTSLAWLATREIKDEKKQKSEKDEKEKSSLCHLEIEPKIGLHGDSPWSTSMLFYKLGIYWSAGNFNYRGSLKLTNGIHSFIIHFLVQWLVVTLIRSEIRNPNFLIQSFLELRLTLSLEMWHHRLIVQNLNFCFIEKINLKIIS